MNSPLSCGYPPLRGGALGGVRDAAQTEQAEHLPDERARRGRVVGLIELVVVGHGTRRLVHGRDDVRDLALDPPHLGAGLRLVPGHPTELIELRVLLRQVRGGGITHDRDAERAQLPVHVRRLVRRHHQVRPVGGDRLHVRVVAVELRARHARRVVGVQVDRLDLAPCTDGVEHLGGGRRQRHDRGRPGRDPDGAVGGVNRHGKPRRRRCRSRRDEQGCRAEQDKEGYPPVPGEHCHPPSVYGGRSAPAPTPDGHRTNRPSSEGLVALTQVRRLGSPPCGSLTIAGQRRIPTGLR